LEVLVPRVELCAVSGGFESGAAHRWPVRRPQCRPPLLPEGAGAPVAERGTVRAKTGAAFTSRYGHGIASNPNHRRSD